MNNRTTTTQSGAPIASDAHSLTTGPDGITATDLSKQVFSELTGAIIKAVASSATDIGKGAQNAASEGVNKIKSGIGSLFGK